MNPRAATTLTTPSEREIVITRVVHAPRRLVFEAYTNPVHLARWMLGPPGWTMPVCEIDLRPGGAWRYIWRRDDGSEMTIQGTFAEIAPPERLVTNESMGAEWPATVNTLLLSEQDGKTAITTHVLYPSKEARDQALKSGMQEGMAETFNRLSKYLETLGAAGA